MAVFVPLADQVRAFRRQDFAITYSPCSTWPGMRVIPISSAEIWQHYSTAWNLLTQGIPFRGWEWLSTWWRHYGEGNELAILAVLNDHDVIVGAAPWFVERTGSRGRVLRALGTGEACSDYASLLCSPEFEDQATAVLAQWLVANGKSFSWDLLHLECVSARDSAAWRLVGHLKEAGCSVVSTAGQNLWSIPLPGTWEEYLWRLSKSHRKQIQRLLRGMRENYRGKLLNAQDMDGLQRGMNQLVDLHQRRWQLANQPGVFASRRFSEFLYDVAVQLHTAQSLQLATLELDGRPAAVDFHLVNCSSNYVYQGGIEPELAGESPGKLLTALLIREAIAAGRTSFDFLRGDERYKPHFRAVPFPSTNLRVVPPRASAQFRHGLWATGVAVRKLVKSGVSLTRILH